MKDNFSQELEYVTNGRSSVRTPQFMGQQKGYSIEQIRALIKKQKRAKGYIFTVPDGSSSFNLDLSGTARIFLGFSLLFQDNTDPNAIPEQFNFVINNEIVIDQTNGLFFSPEFMDDEYYFFPRPLSGTDELQVQFVNSNGSQTVQMIVYYI